LANSGQSVRFAALNIDKFLDQTLVAAAQEVVDRLPLSLDAKASGINPHVRNLNRWQQLPRVGSQGQGLCRKLAHHFAVDDDETGDPETIEN
jgi:hypothetical protein